MTLPRPAEPRPQDRRRSRPLLLLADFGVALTLGTAFLFGSSHYTPTPPPPAPVPGLTPCRSGSSCN
ncbi:hypothetical protein ACFY00_32215 [Kitasatospora sp. NPDC001540]|uniref:hypothetical protein n=1 Tax=Kitasatospora sp. NPDC001540 TaxID=3364014 RepID=UPI0036A69A41